MNLLDLDNMKQKLDIAIESLKIIKGMNVGASELAGKTLNELERIDNDEKEMHEV